MGFLFLVAYSRPYRLLPPTYTHTTTYPQLAHTQLTHTQLSNTQLTHTQLPDTHTHTTPSHTQLSNTQLTRLPTHTHTTYSHTHTTLTQLTHTHNLLVTHNLLTHNSPTHNLLTHNSPTHNLLSQTHTHTHKQLTHTHNLLTFILRGKRGTYGAGLARVPCLAPVWRSCRRGCLCGRRCTWWHKVSLCVAWVALGLVSAYQEVEALAGSLKRASWSRRQMTCLTNCRDIWGQLASTCSKTTHQPRQCVSSALSIVCHRRHRWALPGIAAMCWPCIGGGLDAATVPDRCISWSLPTPQMIANGACCGTCLCTHRVEGVKNFLVQISQSEVKAPQTTCERHDHGASESWKTRQLLKIPRGYISMCRHAARLTRRAKIYRRCYRPRGALQ